MRRPVKPFVTEYRGAVRRTKEAPDSSIREPREDDLPRKNLFRANPPEGRTEDTYGAALKAADALFSPRVPEAIASSTPPTRLDAATETGGRILRAIEQEPPEERHASMPSPERVMKRRGRRPGSKNKPKPATVPHLDVPTTAKAAAGIAAARRPAPGADPIAPVSATKPRPRPAARTRREPFAWVRTKLRPGEKWKRRLPKVVW